MSKKIAAPTVANKSKEEIIAEYALSEGDTGSPEVQIALLTGRISHLTELVKRPPPAGGGRFPQLNTTRWSDTFASVLGSDFRNHTWFRESRSKTGESLHPLEQALPAEGTHMSETTVHSVETIIDNGSFGQRKVRFETGLLARQAGGAVSAFLDDDTMLLSTTTASKQPKDHFDFFPLTVDVEERMYAAGRIPGSFFRREGRPGEDAILTCRLIDRPLRPTFKKGLRNEVQVVITVLASLDFPLVAPLAQLALLSSTASGWRSQLTAKLRTLSSTWLLPVVLLVTTSPS